MPATIRPYRPADLTRLKEITIEGFDGVSIDRNIENHFGEIKGRDWRWRKARHIDYDVVRDPHGAYVAEIDSQIVGYITTWLDRDAGIGNIPNLAVDSNYRGQGIGRQLIEFALQQFRKQGMSHAKIETLEQNEVGQGLYPSIGFVEVARQIHYCMALMSDE